ncbi:hypothetical protein RUM43_013416 [Polyplax serrata]|uniref:peptide-methionine (S)-S-oxide reductase n=1 Tax=Polyplax serrata TaxID=468196 RepID=A0AAN8P5G0_POLSC
MGINFSNNSFHKSKKMNFLHHLDVPTKKATFGMGCFWGVESLFGSLIGVISTRVGFTGGDKEAPVYKNLGNHIEAVEIDFDPSVVSYENLLNVFWTNHNPTARMSRQYISAIFYHDNEQKELAEKSIKEQQEKAKMNILTIIEPAKMFYNAEDYHQKYRLQQHTYLMDALGLRGKPEALLKSHVAARLNGYVVGLGGIQQFEAEADKLGLSGKILDYVKNLVIKYEGHGLSC